MQGGVNHHDGNTCCFPFRFAVLNAESVRTGMSHFPLSSRILLSESNCWHPPSLDTKFLQELVPTFPPVHTSQILHRFCFLLLLEWKHPIIFTKELFSIKLKGIRQDVSWWMRVKYSNTFPFIAFHNSVLYETDKVTVYYGYYYFRGYFHPSSPKLIDCWFGKLNNNVNI